MSNNYPVLYVIVRDDIKTMTHGKAEAHSGHAASKFVWEMFVKHPSKHIKKKSQEWLLATPDGGFGTQINLKGSREDIDSIVDYIYDNKIHQKVWYGRVIDPSYPYEDTITGVSRTRNRMTAFYIFGMKHDLRRLTANMELK